MDTGADVTVLTEETSRLLRVHLVKPTRVLVGAGGSTLRVLGETRARIASKNKSVSATVYVVEGAKRNLLGASQIRELGLLAMVGEIKDEVFNPADSFPELFEGLGTMPGIFTISLKQDTKPKRLFAP